MVNDYGQTTKNVGLGTTFPQRLKPRYFYENLGGTTGSRALPDPVNDSTLDSDHSAQFLYRRSAFVETGFLFGRKFDLDDLFDSLCS